jgi:hypothetical protein
MSTAVLSRALLLAHLFNGECFTLCGSNIALKFAVRQLLAAYNYNTPIIDNMQEPINKNKFVVLN